MKIPLNNEHIFYISVVRLFICISFATYDILVLALFFFRREEAKIFADTFNMDLFETSAKEVIFKANNSRSTYVQFIR